MVSAAQASLAMARSHQAQQIAQAAAVQAALSELWDQTIDPNDVSRSFLLFREKAATLIGGGRLLSERKAAQYYSTVLAAKGLDPLDVSKVTTKPLSAGAIKGSLSAASSKSLARAAYLQSQGLPSAQALAAAKSNMLGSAKRQVLNAGRSHLVAMSRAHKGIRGWARVSDGNPCGFCAMLVGRGPVYSEDTVHFQAHDRCGCSARLVTWDDEDGGWSDDAKAYRWAYENGLLVAHTRGGHKNLSSAHWANGLTADDVIRLWADEQAAMLANAKAAVEAAEQAAKAAEQLRLLQALKAKLAAEQAAQQSKAARIAALKAEAKDLKPNPVDVGKYTKQLNAGTLTPAQLRAAIDAGELTAAQIAAAERAMENAAKAAEKAAKLRDKWLGKPAPKAPVKPAEPSAVVGESAFDDWLQKVKDRYTAFAIKTGNYKTDLTTSHNWPYVQKVIKSHDVYALQQLKGMSYIDDALYDEALAAMTAAKAPVPGAAEAYAKAMTAYKRKATTYKRELSEWQGVNGVSSAPKGLSGALVHKTSSEGVAWANGALTVHKKGTVKARAATSYSGSDYTPWNNALRHAASPDELAGEWGEKTRKLDAIMDPIPEDVIVHRGTSFMEFQVPGFDRTGSLPPPPIENLIGTVQTQHGYTSTSVGDRAAFSSNPVQLRIRVPQGHGAVWVQPVSRYPNERELLLQRSTSYFIHHAEYRGGQWWIDMEVVPDGVDPVADGWQPLGPQQ
ncbi:ADP-ribosyltransferase domain and MuF-like fusion protein [Microbacterium phage IAmGroot]|uniref:ADP-ribosyltransferase domain and MuF-like fusion protein n=1 Tax=Microbacterium phage IAmGroot TaxID=2588486 RepID=A0A4Y6EGJ9_9CAUD|nr:ADP-ribosyltransferase domain and MuF-like fusion protein [Microbacterium phage IAmGroot]